MTMIPPGLRRGFESLLDPIVDRLIRGKASPNLLTTLGTLVAIGSGVAFGFGTVRLGGALLLLSGVFDMLDGKVARGGGRMSPFGAFYDSTLDRIAETGLFLGIAIYFLRGGLQENVVTIGVSVAILALSFGLIVSYTRARAEGLGLECKVGVFQRAERILGLGAPTMFFAAGPDGLLLLGIVGVLALLSVITVVQRISHVRKATIPVTRVEPVGEVRHREAAFADNLREGSGGE